MKQRPWCTSLDSILSNSACLDSYKCFIFISFFLFIHIHMNDERRIIPNTKHQFYTFCDHSFASFHQFQFSSSRCNVMGLCMKCLEYVMWNYTRTFVHHRYRVIQPTVTGKYIIMLNRFSAPELLSHIPNLRFLTCSFSISLLLFFIHFCFVSFLVVVGANITFAFAISPFPNKPLWLGLGKCLSKWRIYIRGICVSVAIKEMQNEKLRSEM